MNLVQKAKLNVVKKHWIQVGEERERERIIQLLHQELASGFAKTFVIGLIKGEK